MSESDRTHRAPTIQASLSEVLKLLPLMAVVVAATACGDVDERPVDELLRTGEVYLDPETMQPYSGLAFATFEGRPDVVAQRLSIREGAYDGPFEAFFKNERLSAKEHYADGVKHGPYEWYFENGRLFEEGTFVNGLLEGPYRAYWDSGDLYEEGTYLAGQFDGPRRWYKDGRLVELVTYRHGVIQGLYERHGEDGEVLLKGELYDGSPCGPWLDHDRAISYPACGARVTQ